MAAPTVEDAAFIDRDPFFAGEIMGFSIRCAVKVYSAPQLGNHKGSHLSLDFRPDHAALS